MFLGLPLAEGHRPLERRRPDVGVHLRCVDPRVAEQRTDLLQVVMLTVRTGRERWAC